MFRKSAITGVILFITGLIIYWSTCYPSITWWETSEYAAAAATLGISGPPGSLILTLCGWFLSRFASHNPAFLLNLFAGALASLIVTFCFITFKKLGSFVAGGDDNKIFSPTGLLIIIPSLIIICSATIWEYAVMFTPYILTALFTIVIFYSVLNWWGKSDRADSWRQLFIVALLTGLDFSVHRTNAVLVPGIIVVMLIKKPSVFLNYRSYLASISGLLLGLSLQLLYIPISLRDPLMNMGEPGSLSGWWSYFSLKQYGGSFLMDILTRKGPLFSYQIPYYLKGFSSNFFYPDNTTHLLGFIPGILGMAGFFSIYKKDKKLFLALALFLVITIIVSILYFNLPANYFRTIYRHYLPTFIIFSVYIFTGTLYIGGLINRMKSSSRLIFTSLFVLLIAGTAVTQYCKNLGKNNGRSNYFTVSQAKNILSSVDDGGIIFSYADNDYFPEVYLQIAEKIRTDIIQCNLSLLNADWYVMQNKRHYRNFPFRGDGIDLSKFDFGSWKEEIITIPLDDNVRKVYGTDMDSVSISFPALRHNNSNFLQDVVLFDIIKNNRWERPIYFIKNGLEAELYNWLRPHLCDKGLVYEFVPDQVYQPDYSAMETFLEKADLSGYNDLSILIDDMSRNAGLKYYDIYLSVARHKAELGDSQGTRQWLDRMSSALPFERLNPGEDIIKLKLDIEEKIN